MIPPLPPLPWRDPSKGKNCDSFMERDGSRGWEAFGKPQGGDKGRSGIWGAEGGHMVPLHTPCVRAGVSTGDPSAPADGTPWHGLALPCSSVGPLWLVAAWPSLGTRHHWMECLLLWWDGSGLVPCLGDSRYPPGWASPRMLGQAVLSPVLLSGMIGRCQSGGVPAPLTPFWERGPYCSVGFWGISFSPLHLTWLCQ